MKRPRDAFVSFLMVMLFLIATPDWESWERRRRWKMNGFDTIDYFEKVD